jgi:CTP synthase (UTP-ammonia lyase)
MSGVNVLSGKQNRLPPLSQLSYNEIPVEKSTGFSLFAKRVIMMHFKGDFMSTTVRIVLIGDFSPDVPAHLAIPRALELAAGDLGVAFETTWMQTDAPALQQQPPFLMDTYDGIWCVPGSPYASMDGALHAITFARQHPLPFLGTCGGGQHALIEYARNVLGLAKADHAETNPTSELPLIAPLSCSLVEVSGSVRLIPGTRIAQIYGETEIREQYHCNFGPSLQYQHLFDDGVMRIAGLDEDGQARAFELTTHPFYILTLFQPERSASSNVVHPLIRAFVQAML